MRAQQVRRTAAAASSALLCLAFLPAANADAAPRKLGARPAHGEQVGNYDSRSDGPARKVLDIRAANLNAKPTNGVKALRQELGTQGIVDLDPLTATPRRVTRIDGFLTGPSRKPAAQIAKDYLKSHTDVFGLAAAQVDGLVLRNTYVDIEGTSHLSFVQQVGGVSVFGNGVKAHVTRNGRLLQVDGAPVRSLPASAGAPALDATQARAKAVADTFGTSSAKVTTSAAGGNRKTTFTGGDQAQLVVFDTLNGPRLAWQTLTMREGFVHVIDAGSGRTLFRQRTTADDNATTWDNFPGAKVGGTQQTRNLTKPFWLPNDSPRLAGNTAHVYMDVNDNNTADPGEEVGPSGRRSFAYPFKPVSSAACAPGFQCSWDPAVANSWRTNAKQNAVQMFYFVSKMHDHLAKAPIGFTRSAGNFEAVDGDAVQGEALDGANIAGGLPDGAHVNNANMNTPPDGTPPRMQMYLFHQPGTAFPAEDPFIAGNSGDDSDVVYHEYTHGLSNRLVVDANGVSTLGDIQAGAMGEAWSDWYAMDFLVNEGQLTDTPKPGELRVGDYVGGGKNLIRTQPLDCPVGATAPACPGTPGAGPGGYTYGDYSRVAGGPEVHADGEIWGETLWDLRTALGVKSAESLVTRAMELSPANPSYLDMRNSILAADLVVNDGKLQKRIWQVFAARGMGFFAGAVDGNDAQPVEDFSMPPGANTPRGSLTGKVTDADTGAAVAGAVVAFGGHNSGFAGDYAATTDAAGSYTINGILPGTYPKVFARGAGFDPVVQTVSVGARANTVNWPLRRDWAAAAGGGKITDFTPPDYTPFGCGPGGLIDQSQAAGWGSDAPTNPAPSAQPKFAVIQLPVAVNISELQVNPSSTCGDAGSASTGDYKVETSKDGTTWTLGNAGHFTPNDRKATTVPLAAGSGAGVRFIRYTMISTQVKDLGGTCPGAFDGCNFMDSTEVGVYGKPA
jgi:extracellular elastinolytic metalloproteinase